MACSWCSLRNCWIPVADEKTNSELLSYLPCWQHCRITDLEFDSGHPDLEPQIPFLCLIIRKHIGMMSWAFSLAFYLSFHFYLLINMNLIPFLLNRIQHLQRAMLPSPAYLGLQTQHLFHLSPGHVLVCPSISMMQIILGVHRSRRTSQREKIQLFAQGVHFLSLALLLLRANAPLRDQPNSSLS